MNNHTGCCEDDQFVGKVKESMEVEDTLYDLAYFFKMLGDSTRVKILAALLHGEMCVATLTDILEMNQSAVSHQLSILKAARLIRSRKEGKWVFYAINDEHVATIYKMGLDHIKE
jgi:ArsR family transcriptional regulator